MFAHLPFLGPSQFVSNLHSRVCTHHEHILALHLETDFQTQFLNRLETRSARLEESLEAMSVRIKILNDFLSHFTEAHFDPLVNALQVHWAHH